MSTHVERILAYLEGYPEGASDRTLHEALGISPYSQVNQICNRFANKGKLIRTKDPTRDVWLNRLPPAGVAPASGVAPAARAPGPQPSPAVGDLRAGLVPLRNTEEAAAFAYPLPINLTEDWIKSALRAALAADAWAVEVAWGHARGIDLIATRDDSRLIIEAKGEGTRDPMYNNYFLGALGELLQRMDGAEALYGLAFPAHRKFVRLAAELSPWVRARLQLRFYFAKPAGDGSALVGVLLPPGNEPPQRGTPATNVWGTITKRGCGNDCGRATVIAGRVRRTWQWDPSRPRGGRDVARQSH